MRPHLTILTTTKHNFNHNIFWVRGVQLPSIFRSESSFNNSTRLSLCLSSKSFKNSIDWYNWHQPRLSDSVFHKCFTSVSPVFHQCFISVSPVFHQCFTSVSPVFHHCFNSVSTVLQQCFTSVSILFLKPSKRAELIHSL